MLLGETSENPKCHLHIPQFKKGIHVCEHHCPRHPRKKKDAKESDLKGMPKTLMPLIGVSKLNGGENHEGNFERDQTTHLWG